MKLYTLTAEPSLPSLKAETLKLQLRGCCHSVRLAALSSLSRQRTVLTAFLVRHVGIQGADEIEPSGAYLQARFTHHLDSILSPLSLGEAFAFIAAVVADGAFLCSHAYQLPRALVAVPKVLRPAALIFLLCLPCAGSVTIVTLKGGNNSCAAQLQLLCWVQRANADKQIKKHCIVKL
jgi:hypothetical protein